MSSTLFAKETFENSSTVKNKFCKIKYWVNEYFLIETAAFDPSAPIDGDPRAEIKMPRPTVPFTSRTPAARRPRGVFQNDAREAASRIERREI